MEPLFMPLEEESEEGRYIALMGEKGGLAVPPSPPPLPSGKRASSARRFCTWGGECVPSETICMWDCLFSEGRGADCNIRTEDGGAFKAHSIILVSSSCVFRSLLESQHIKEGRFYSVTISGVPLEAAKVFIRFLYSSRYEDADISKYILHLVLLSHVYCIPSLKNLCTRCFEHKLLTIDNVVDVLQLARLCDVPRLSLMCLRLIIKEFNPVVKTEGWRVMRESDPSLEQELLEAVIDTDSRKQEKIRKLEADKVYGQLRDAMDALVHICRDGCLTIGPHDKALLGKLGSPCKFVACKGLESLLRHFRACVIKVSGGCIHCKHMWQLLELHSRICQDSENCRVPLCSPFKDKSGVQSKKEEHKWRLLASKVMTARRSMSDSFSLADISEKLEQA